MLTPMTWERQAVCPVAGPVTPLVPLDSTPLRWPPARCEVRALPGVAPPAQQGG